MKLCVPVRMANGLESCIEPHLPNAEHLLIIDTDTRELQHVSLRDRPAGEGEAPRFDAVLCGSIDSATKGALVEKGILAFGTEARTAGEAIAEFEEANLAAYRSGGGCGNSGRHAGGGCCGGHDHGEEHSHAHTHEGGGCCGGGEGRAGKDGHGCGGKGGCGGQGHGDEHGHAHKGEGGGGCGCGGQDRQPDAIARKMGADALRIAVSSQNRKTVTDHAGRCRKFWVYEVRQNKVHDKTLRELTLEQTLHSSPLGDDHPLDDVHVMITAGMSPFLYQRLQRGGIKGFVTDEADPDKAVQMLLDKVAQR